MADTKRVTVVVVVVRVDEGWKVAELTEDEDEDKYHYSMLPEQAFATFREAAEWIRKNH